MDCKLLNRNALSPSQQHLMTEASNQVLASLLAACASTCISCMETAPRADGTSVKTANYFSSSYEAAREMFLDAAAGAGARIESLRHPDVGPNGEPLFTDVAVLGPQDVKNILVVSSGTHGVEGFAGSGIQVGLLREGIASKCPRTWASS